MYEIEMEIIEEQDREEETNEDTPIKNSIRSI